MIYNLKLKLICSFINFKIRKVGHMLNIKIDPDNKSIKLSVLLLGEDEPLDVFIKSYELIEENNKSYIKISEIETSKTWLNILVSEFVEHNKIEISNKTSKLLKIII